MVWLVMIYVWVSSVGTSNPSTTSNSGTLHVGTFHHMADCINAAKTVNYVSVAAVRFNFICVPSGSLN